MDKDETKRENASSESASLKEYETCQSELNKRGNQFWVSLSIIISINLILLTQSTNVVITNGLSHNVYTNLAAVLILAITMVIINYAFRKWQKRQHYVTQVIYQRMQKIEDGYGMHRNLLINGLDLKNDPDKQSELEKLSDSRKMFIDKLIASYPDLPKKYERPYGHRVFGRILCILIALWVALAVFAVPYILLFCS